MKVFHLLTFALLLSVAFTSCSNTDSDKIRQEAKESISTTPAPGAAASNKFNVLDSSTGSTNNEPHYKCPSNCAGGTGAAAGNCPVCGIAMVHNQAFHNNGAAPDVGTPSLTAPGTPGTSGTPPPPAPAQNASGVFHYTCASGCTGGAGAAGNCATCGKALVHNQDYHN